MSNRTEISYEVQRELNIKVMREKWQRTMVLYS